MKKLLLLILLLPFVSFGQKSKISADASKSSLKYFMSHPMHDWDAKAQNLKVLGVWNAETKQMEMAAVVVAIKDFDSENSNRDSHALEVLEALKYPTVSFSSQKLTYSNNKISISGTLDFHGVKKAINTTATQTEEANGIKISGSFSINMTDFGIKPPGLMGVTTKEDIKLEYSFWFPKS